MAASGATGSASAPLRESRGINARILDASARERRQKKFLEALEQDNLHEEPHADLVMSKKIPKFRDSLEPRSKPGPSAKKRKLRSVDYYRRFAKSFQQLLEEDWARQGDRPAYLNCESPPSIRPPRKLCNVCGFPCAYTCTQCGVFFCTVKCMTTHRETRCLKWIA